MVNKSMNLFTKRFRSKAPSSVSPSLSRFVNLVGSAFIFSQLQSPGRGEGEGDKAEEFDAEKFIF